MINDEHIKVKSNEGFLPELKDARVKDNDLELVNKLTKGSVGKALDEIDNAMALSREDHDKVHQKQNVLYNLKQLHGQMLELINDEIRELDKSFLDQPTHIHAEADYFAHELVDHKVYNIKDINKRIASIDNLNFAKLVISYFVGKDKARLVRESDNKLFCGACGTEVQTNFNFCHNCSAKIQWRK